MNASEAVFSTSEPAFAVDAEGHILSWNSAAADLYGYSASQVLGQRCWEVLQGQDPYGNDYCVKDCQLRWMAWQGRPVHPCEIVFRNVMGQPIRALVSLLAVPVSETSDLALVHLIRPFASDGEGQEPVDTRVCPIESSGQLTRREAQILGLLADGKGTKEIAELLIITTATVRNHIQNILAKLKVHSRLEAVALARRIGLLADRKIRR